MKIETINKMDKEIEMLIKINTLRDVEIKFREALLKGFIIPELVFEVMKDLEAGYRKENE
jgi:hypothetical protein